MEREHIDRAIGKLEAIRERVYAMHPAHNREWCDQYVVPLVVKLYCDGRHVPTWQPPRGPTQ